MCTCVVVYMHFEWHSSERRSVMSWYSKLHYLYLRVWWVVGRTELSKIHLRFGRQPKIFRSKNHRITIQNPGMGLQWPGTHNHYESTAPRHVKYRYFSRVSLFQQRLVLIAGKGPRLQSFSKFRRVPRSNAAYDWCILCWYLQTYEIHWTKMHESCSMFFDAKTSS